jgi:hypothetical protein
MFGSIDSCFPFTTTKVVQVRDYRLGVANIVILVVFFVGALGYSMAWNGQHLAVVESHDSPIVRGRQTRSMDRKFGHDGLGIPLDFGNIINVPLGTMIKHEIWIEEENGKETEGHWNPIDGQTRASAFRDIEEFEFEFKDDVPGVTGVESICKREYPKSLGDAVNKISPSWKRSIYSKMLRNLSSAPGDEMREMLQQLAQNRMTIARFLSNEHKFDPFGLGKIRCEVKIEIENDMARTVGGGGLDFHAKVRVDPPLASPAHWGNRRFAGIAILPIDMSGQSKIRRFSQAKAFAFIAGYSALLTIAHLIVRNVALYVLPKQTEYYSLIVEISQDFNPDDGQVNSPNERLF